MLLKLYIFNNEVQIEPITMYNLGETNLSLTDGINSNLEFLLMILIIFLMKK